MSILWIGILVIIFALAILVCGVYKWVHSLTDKFEEIEKSKAIPEDE